MKPFRTRIEDVPLEQGLREDEGWIDMQVQFLIGEHNAGARDLVVGRTVLTPGARHERHLHPNCDEFLVVLSGHGEIYTNTGREPSKAGDVIYTPRGNWHGFDNTSDEDVLLFWGWSGAGSLEAAGYAIDDRIPAGMREQLARRADERGERQIGWKVGFGAPGAMEMLKIDRPLVGFLTEAGLVADGADVPVGCLDQADARGRDRRPPRARRARRGLVGGGPRRDRRPVGGDRARRPRPAARGRPGDPGRQHLPPPRRARPRRPRPLDRRGDRRPRRASTARRSPPPTTPPRSPASSSRWSA